VCERARAPLECEPLERPACWRPVRALSTGSLYRLSLTALSNGSL
jgi:hypothetical protein